MHPHFYCSPHNSPHFINPLFSITFSPYPVPLPPPSLLDIPSLSISSNLSSPFSTGSHSHQVGGQRLPAPDDDVTEGHRPQPVPSARPENSLQVWHEPLQHGQHEQRQLPAGMVPTLCTPRFSELRLHSDSLPFTHEYPLSHSPSCI